MNNPANEKERGSLPPGYQPMSMATKRLEVPEREGFHRRWFRGEPGRLARAQQAGYRFVDKQDVMLNNFDLGGDAKDSGDTDLGTRVSVIAGDDIDPSGQPGRLYLMECPNELYEYSRSIIEDINEGVAESLRGGSIGSNESGESSHDARTRYTKGKMPELFTPKSRR
jgi:hypothetical protein